MPGVKLTKVEKSFGAVKVIHGVSMEIERGEFAVFVGPSGCGKSTLLRMIAGLEETTAGRIEIEGRDVTEEEPAKRGVAMVFQSYALYPHLTVFENMAFSLRLARAAAGRGRGQGRRGRAHPAARGPPAEEALAALRRPAPARGDRPRHRAPAQGLPLRRAALQPRRRAPRADAARARAAAQADRRDDDLRDPRPGRGDDAGRQDLRAAVAASCGSPGGRSSSTTTPTTASSPASSARRP